MSNELNELLKAQNELILLLVKETNLGKTKTDESKNRITTLVKILKDFNNQVEK